MAEPSNATDRKCANCNEPLNGEYCGACGQHVVDIDVPLRKFLAESIHESFALDSKLFRTLKPLLFKPAFSPRNTSRDAEPDMCRRYVFTSC